MNPYFDTTDELDELDLIARDEFDKRRRVAQNTTRRIRRGAPRNALGEAQNRAELGWLGRALTIMGQTRRHALSINPHSSVIVTQEYPLQLLPNTPGGVFNACVIATQGAGEKTTGRIIMPGVIADQSITLGTRRVFGVHVKITDSQLNFKQGTYTVQLLDGATILSQAVVLCPQGQVDLVMLAIGNTGGMASIPGAAAPVVKFIAAGSDFVAGNTALFAETLNMRDLGVVANASGGLATS